MDDAFHGSAAPCSETGVAASTPKFSTTARFRWATT
jgi:hypothetical protein